MIDFTQRLKQKACPKCKRRRLLAGPFYARGRLRCLFCGWCGKTKLQARKDMNESL